ncbi:SDR family NAD(P)-dependent oxidoreductase [candidate division KSB1 bacterium]|nr:SDR family NAD(P)-dependent oxidoreductase [candidate division KSB1 bacterium]RQW03212.1 MAG: SDR family NAD(P)-dependent oxidoreductase [candidate division KSB1 bacterium]
MISNKAKHKVACITGATSGIGAAFARQFAARGYDLLLTGRRQRKIEGLAQELRTMHKINVSIKILDFVDEKALENFAAQVRNVQNLHVLVNNAGFGAEGSFHQQHLENHLAMIRVHNDATIRLCHAALPGMLERHEGTIINVSSVRSFVPSPVSAMYAATKAFVTMFTESLHLEYADSGIRVQALCPGLTRTDFHEKMGFDTGKFYQDKGVLKAMTAEKVVAISLRDLDKGKVVCLPGLSNKLLYRIARLLPAGVLCVFSRISSKRIESLKR